MTGVRQHTLPRFLLKGFSSRNDGKNFYIWVFQKNAEPYETNILNVAVQKDFYSSRGNTYIDDTITDAEGKFVNLVNDVRSFKVSAKIESKNIPEFIAHLEVRTRHLRESFKHLSNSFLKEIIEFFQDSEKVSRFIERQVENKSSTLNAAIKKEINKLSLPGYKRRQLNNLLLKKNYVIKEFIENQFRDFINHILPQLSNQMPDIVRQGHLLGLKNSISPKVRINEYNRYGWFVNVEKNENYILGDFAVLFEVESSSRFKTFWEKGEKIIRIFIPLSNKHLLIGSSIEYNNFSSPNILNETIAKCSREYFISAVNNLSIIKLINLIGKKSKLLKDEEIYEIVEKLFENDLIST